MTKKELNINKDNRLLINLFKKKNTLEFNDFQRTYKLSYAETRAKIQQLITIQYICIAPNKKAIYSYVKGNCLPEL